MMILYLPYVKPSQFERGKTKQLSAGVTYKDTNIRS